jgi:alcohol dehydrogenase
MADTLEKREHGLATPAIDTEVSFEGIDAVLRRMKFRDVFGTIVLPMSIDSA